MSAPFPHCNSEVLHAPGDCYYCDKYPGMQKLRAAGGNPFSPLEANGWSGNVAVKAGDYHEHMGFGFIVGGEPQSFDDALEVLDSDKPCRINFKRGWYCKSPDHSDQPDQPCALIPKWWNLRYRRLRRMWR